MTTEDNNPQPFNDEPPPKSDLAWWLEHERDPLGDFLRKREAPALDSDDSPLPPEPARVARRDHGLYSFKTTQTTAGPCVTLDQGRQQIRDAIKAYLADPDPGYMLLVAAPAGSGKTTIAIETAEYAAMMLHQRVLFAGPRREFWQDIVDELRRNSERRPAWWYEWKPRTLGQGQGVGQTCRHAPAIDIWQKRGYQGIDFCKRVCGYSYINDGCTYHAQRQRQEPIIFVQHEHVTLAHPLMAEAGLVIGDELPIRSFLHRWEIPTAQIVTADMEHSDSELAGLMRSIRQVTVLPLDKEDGPYWHGPALLRALGGPERVLRICNETTLDVGALAVVPNLPSPESAEDAPYFHLPSVVSLLRREAAEAVAGREYISRVLVNSDGLILLQRRSPTQLPSHVIWLDATGDPTLYERLFNRPVRLVRPNIQLQGTIYQVYASRNNKHALETEDAKRAHVKAQIDTLKAPYSNPAVITYKGLVDELAGGSMATHFGGNRGTNRLQECDGLIVAGTPQPDMTQLTQMAAMLFADRMAPFKPVWSYKPAPFEGTDRGHTIGGYWDDPDLQLLVSQFREAELIQAINRARPLIRPVDIWLLSNVPLPGVPVTLKSLNEMFDAPQGVDPYRWPQVLELADSRFNDGQPLTAADVVEAIEGVTAPTARKWLAILVKAQPDRWESPPPDYVLPKRGRGRPSVFVIPCDPSHENEY